MSEHEKDEYAPNQRDALSPNQRDALWRTIQLKWQLKDELEVLTSEELRKVKKLIFSFEKHWRRRTNGWVVRFSKPDE